MRNKISNKKSEARARTIIALTLTLFVALILLSIVHADTWTVNTQASFNEGTYEISKIYK